MESYIKKRTLFISLFLSAALTCGVLLAIHYIVSPPMLLVERFFPGFGWIEILILTIYSVLLTYIMVTTHRIGRWRSVYWRAFSLVFFIQLLLGLTVSSTFLMSGNLHLPVPAMIVAGPLYRGGRFFMPILLSSTILIVGPGWCGHLCYIGAWDDTAAKIKRRADTTTLPLKYLRYVILLLTIVIPLTLKYTGTSDWVGLSIASLFGVGGVFIMAIFSTKQGRMAHCTTYCPIGALVVVMGKLSPFRLQIDQSNCNMCRDCLYSCRYGALDTMDLKKGRAGLNCVLCGDCISSCSQRAMRVSLFRSEINLWPIYASLAVSLHAIFVGLARI